MAKSRGNGGKDFEVLLRASLQMLGGVGDAKVSARRAR